jgi:energy-coupling factor transport system substrate-specific component
MGMSPKTKAVVYPIVCALHGLLYGTLYAPAQALMFGLDVQGMVAWIVAGFPYDLLHMVGNLLAGLLILPLSQLLQKLLKGKL